MYFNLYVLTKTKDYKFHSSNNTLSHTLNAYLLSPLPSMLVRTVINSHVSPLKITKNTCRHLVLMLDYILRLSFRRYVYIDSRCFEITNSSTNSFPCVQWHLGLPKSWSQLANYTSSFIVPVCPISPAARDPRHWPTTFSATTEPRSSVGIPHSD